MNGPADVYYRAFLARDYRFDGKFFVAVKTTGIYCRPICPARPKRENMEFFKDAASAERAGYRPCLRCRPESAPLSPAWMGRSAVVQRALRLIANQQRSDLDENEFAAYLGVSARHLRRLFDEELGITPKQLADRNRLDFARKLIVETQIPITQIAFSSGFSSLRRFNDAVKTRFHRAPRELRRSSPPTRADHGIRLTLSYRPPFDWDSLLGFYNGHLVPGVENVQNNGYERVFAIDGEIGALRITNEPENSRLICEIKGEHTKNLKTIVYSVRHFFDLDSDPLLITQAFSASPILKRLARKYPGLRLPRAWDPYETAVCSILGQVVSSEQRSNLVHQLVQTYGKKIRNPATGNEHFLFPEVKVLANEKISGVGATQARLSTISEFSKRLLEKKIRLDPFQELTEFRNALLDIKGIGPWTVEYICLRAMGDTDAFPTSDLILKRVLDNHPKLELETTKPWRGYAAMYLWKEYARTLSKKKVRAYP